ncbi:hypothetical protein, partial [Mycobacterium canetti]|uniref:hypothetical protein n=1 Tax=Mycobacterium canetti TaxID=78331 RepID=UPI001E388583
TPPIKPHEKSRLGNLFADQGVEEIGVPFAGRGSRLSMMEVDGTNPSGRPLLTGTGLGVHRDG